MTNSVKRVLMVDDDLRLCESVRDYLAGRTDEYNFLGAVCTYPSAIEYFRDGMPDIVILDMMLGPGLDGSDLVEVFKKIEREQGFHSNIFVFSRSQYYEDYCAQNHLMFVQKGDTPELMMKRIERFMGSTPLSIQPIKMNMLPPKSRTERMQDYLFSVFSHAGAHTYTGFKDCLVIIPRIIELMESGIEYPMEKVYREHSKKVGSSVSAVEGRISNMLKALWTKASMDVLRDFYPPDLGKENTAPTPLPFIDYYVKLLMRMYPKNIEQA